MQEMPNRREKQYNPEKIKEWKKKKEEMIEFFKKFRRKDIALKIKNPPRNNGQNWEKANRFSRYAYNLRDLMFEAMKEMMMKEKEKLGKKPKKRENGKSKNNIVVVVEKQREKTQ
jgi:hypothetical protein